MTCISLNMHLEGHNAATVLLVVTVDGLAKFLSVYIMEKGIGMHVTHIPSYGILIIRPLQFPKYKILQLMQEHILPKDLMGDEKESTSYIEQNEFDG